MHSGFFNYNTYAIFSACQLGRTELATMLLQQGAEPSAHPVTGYTPLYTACHHGHVNTAKLLLEKYPELVQVLPFYLEKYNMTSKHDVASVEK